MSEWREIWKKSIETSQKSILIRDFVGELFDELRNEQDKEDGTFPYKDDRMVDFEEGITFECLGLYDKAIQLLKDELNDVHASTKKMFGKAMTYSNSNNESTFYSTSGIKDGNCFSRTS